MKGIGGAPNKAFVVHSVVDDNTTAAVLTGSPSSIIETNGGGAISYGNNLLRNAGAPTQTLPLQ